MRGECPVAGAGALGSGAPRTLFLTAFTIDFSRFEVHFSCSVWVLRRDSISAHIWYGLRTNLNYPTITKQQPTDNRPTDPQTPASTNQTNELIDQVRVGRSPTDDSEGQRMDVFADCGCPPPIPSPFGWVMAVHFCLDSVFARTVAAYILFQS